MWRKVMSNYSVLNNCLYFFVMLYYLVSVTILIILSSRWCTFIILMNNVPDNKIITCDLCVSYPTSNDIRIWNNFSYVCVASIFADKQIAFSYISLCHKRLSHNLFTFLLCARDIWKELFQFRLFVISFCPISCQIKIYYANERNVFTGKYFHDQWQNLIRKFVRYCITDIFPLQTYVRLSADEARSGSVEDLC